MTQLQHIAAYAREYKLECEVAQYSDTAELWRIINLFTTEIEGKDHE